jgi:hypothetical protein
MDQTGASNPPNEGSETEQAGASKPSGEANETEQASASYPPDEADDLKGPHEVYEGDDTDPTQEELAERASGDPDVDMAPVLVIGTFASEAAGKASYEEIREAEREQILLFIDAALVSRDHENELHIHEDQNEMRGSRGTLFGATIGRMLSLVGRGGGVENPEQDAFDKRLTELAANLKPDSSMVVVAVAHYWSDLTSAFLTRAGGEVSTAPVTDELARELGR